MLITLQYFFVCHFRYVFSIKSLEECFSLQNFKIIYLLNEAYAHLIYWACFGCQVHAYYFNKKKLLLRFFQNNKPEVSTFLINM